MKLFKKCNQKVAADGKKDVLWTLHINTLKINENHTNKKNSTHFLIEKVISFRKVYDVVQKSQM